LIHDQLEEMGSGEMFDISEKKIGKENIYFEIVYWKESLLHALDSSHRYNRLILQLPNHPIFEFIERVQAKDSSLFSGLSNEDILHISHKPELPSVDSILRLCKTLTSQAQNQDVLSSNYARVQQILLFETSKRVLLKEFSLANNFLEILAEVKLLYQTYLLLYYYSRLCKDLQSKELREAIRLCCRDTKDWNQEKSPMSQDTVYISVALEGNALFLYINLQDGRMDFIIEPANKTVEVHKNRLKEILYKTPSNFTEVIVFYKKILLLSTFSNILSKENAKLHSHHGAKEDNFKIVIYKSNSKHNMNIDNKLTEVMVDFTNKIVFDDEAKNLTITTQFSINIINNPNRQWPSLKKELNLSLTPFDLKLITKKFDFFIRHLKYKGFYDFERRKNEEHIPHTNFEKPISQISSSLEQSFNITENSIIITLKPSYPISENYISYINSFNGTKLVFSKNPHKPKAFEIYEKNKLTIKYASVLEAYMQITKDIQRLESHVNSLGRERNRLEEDIQMREYHSASFYNIGDRISVTYLNDKVVEIYPQKYLSFIYYHDQQRDERDNKIKKMALIRELKQGLNVFDAGIDLNYRKNELAASKDQSSSGQENGVQHERREGGFRYYLQYNVELVPIDPWRFMLFWRGIADDLFANFRFDFQILGENELECFGLYMEYPNAVDKIEFGPGHKFRMPIKKAFATLSAKFAENAGRVVANHDAADTSDTLKLKIYSKQDFVTSALEMTKFTMQLSQFVMKNKIA